MKPRSYISVSGAKTLEETGSIANAYSGQGLVKGGEIIPVIGYQCSTKRIKDPSTGDRGSPALSTLREHIQTIDNRCSAALHYFTKDRTTLHEQVKAAMEQIHPAKPDLLQLNVEFPSLAQVEAIRDSYPGMSVIMQLALDPGQYYRPEKVAEQVKGYEGLIDYALIDPSLGEGIEEDTARHLELMQMLDSCSLTVSLSGGFDAMNIESRLSPVISSFGNHIGIDAEGRLMFPGTRTLDMKRAKSYISKGSRILKDMEPGRVCLYDHH